MNKKILIACLFVCILLIGPIVTAVDANIYRASELRKKSKIDYLDKYSEIFTQIGGICSKVEGKQRGLFIHRDVELWMSPFWGLNIKGIRIPSNIYEMDYFFDVQVNHVRVPCLIGLLEYNQSHCSVAGFAIGNIEWD